MQFQFRDIRPKAASEIADISEASALLGHSKEGITERVYRRIGAVANKKPRRPRSAGLSNVEAEAGIEPAWADLQSPFF